MLVFSSDQLEGKGEKDLWLSRILPNGDWGPIENLGDVINTDEDESFPYFSPDGKTLYFASSGHNSMGGYDIFKTAYNDSTKKWSKPINLGYPINNSDDNTVISFANNKKYAYISSHRPEGFGYTDIYRITFNDLPSSYTIVKGEIILPDSSNLFTPGKFSPPAPIIENKNANSKTTEIKQQATPEIDVTIKIQNKNDKSDFGIYRPNKQTGRFVMNLPTGEYIAILSGNGLQTTTDEILVPDKELYSKEISKPLIVRIQETIEPIE